MLAGGAAVKAFSECLLTKEVCVPAGMTDSLAVALGVLRQSCGPHVQALPLHTVLTGIWHVILWAANSACSSDVGASPARALGMHVGTAAVFLVADKLLCCRVGRRIGAALQVSLEALVAWLYPADKQFGRRADGALRALAGLLAANGLLLLKNRARTQQAHQVGRLLTAGQRAVFWPHSFPWIALEERQRAVSELAHLQLLAVRAPDISLEHYGTQLADASVLYQWLGPSRYVGVAGVQRPSRPMTPGPAQRWWEHLLHRCRPNLKGASLKKYGLFRKAGVSLQGFLVCRAGPSTMMNAGELLEVRCHRPPANAHPKLKLRHHSVPRARPPRSCRGYTKHQVRDGTFEGNYGSKLFDIALGRAKKAQTFHSDQRQRQDPMQSLRMNFKTAYRHLQQVRRAHNNLAGPLNVYCRTHWRLALLFLSTPGSKFCWATMDKHWGSSCAALLLWKKAGLWLSYRRRLLVQQRIDFLLRERGLPTTHGVTVKVPSKAFIPAVRQAVDLAVRRHPGLDGFLQHYVRRQSRLVVGKQRCFSDLQNCSARAVDFQWSKVADCSDDFLAAAITGTAAERVEYNWQFPVRTQRHEDVDVVKKCVQSWARQLSWPYGTRSFSDCAASVLRHSRAWNRTHDAWDNGKGDYTRLTAPLHRTKAEILCPDDKQKQFKWRVPLCTYFLMLAWFVLVSPTWCDAGLTIEEANSWCVALLMNFVPAPLQRLLGISPQGWFLPYCYGSFKDKCFSGGRRICSKVGHSCMRRIVSYVKWPARRAWRRVGRAISFILRTTLLTDEIWALKDSREAMEQRLGRLLPPRQVGICDRCGGACLDMQGLTADAGQFFEAVSASEACAAFHRTLQIAKADGHSSVTVAGDRTVFYGGCIFRSLRRCTVFLLNDLYWIFAAACCIKYAHTGDKVWTFSGLPIGGLLSKVAASCVLGLQEHVWSSSPDKRAQTGFAFNGRLWNHMVARGRYVDDVVWFSRALCLSCLQEGIPAVYSVPFEIQLPAHGVLTWLDFHMSLPTMRWSVRRKVFFPRHPSGASQKYAFSVLMARLARWREMQLAGVDMAEAMVHFFFDFMRGGWNKKLLGRAVYCAARRCPVAQSRLLLSLYHLCCSP